MCGVEVNFTTLIKKKAEANLFASALESQSSEED
jgi:hypothetical protein